MGTITGFDAGQTMPRRIARLAWPVLAAWLLAACVLGGSPVAAQAADPVVAAAGDIACDPGSPYFNGGEGDARNCRQKHTSDLLVDAGLAAVLPLGDIQYHDGAAWKYTQSYDPTWGRLKAITRPAVGNHEYFTADASTYFDYFNGAGAQTGPAGDRDKGYYSFGVGSWRLIALNSNCSEVGGCAPGSPQERWLRAELAAHPASCTLAYWHHPLFTSGGTWRTSMEPIWQALHDGGADVVLNGHSHHYERFAPQDPTGTADPSHGIRQFIVGTGGKSLGGTGTPLATSEVRDTDTHGVLKLTLGAVGYDWRFVGAPGTTFTDAGSGACHDRPPPRPPTANTGRATAPGETSARLNAAVDPNAHATTYRFEYGRTAAYGSSTPAQDAGRIDSSPRQVSALIEALEPGVTYHYRVVATNVAGTVVGEDRTVVAGARAGGRYAETVKATAGLLSYWRLGDGGGGFGLYDGWAGVADEHGGQLGVLTAGAAFGLDRTLGGDGKLGARFDGTSGEMTVNAHTLSASATLEGWFVWENGGALIRDDSWADGWILAYDSGGRLAYRVAGKAFRTGRSAAAVKDGRWHHLALTKDGESVALYLDGEQVHAGIGVPNVAATAPWHVMRNGVRVRYARGRADDVAIYDRALPPSVVGEHYVLGRAERLPDTGITVGPDGPTSDANPRFSFASRDPDSTFTCTLEGPAPAGGGELPCGSPHSFSGLADGEYTLSVRAHDAGGADPTPAVRSFAIDTTAPDTSIEGGPGGVVGDAHATFSFSSPDAGAAFQCRLGTTAWRTCSSPARYAGLPSGPYRFAARAVDAVGNADPTPAERVWVVRRMHAQPPARHGVLSGRLDEHRGGVWRLARDDGDRLEISAAYRPGRGYVADGYADASIAGTARRTLRRLSVTYDGNVSTRRASVRLRIFDHRARRWVTIRAWRRGTVSDRRSRWSVSRSGRDYVSRRGKVRVRLTATAGRPFRTRTDVLRVAVEY